MDLRFESDTAVSGILKKKHLRSKVLVKSFKKTGFLAIGRNLQVGKVRLVKLMVCSYSCQESHF